MPKSETPKDKGKGATKTTYKSSHISSKPYMRALRAQSPTSIPTAAWSTTDDELLLRTKSSGKKWVEISPLFPGKTSNACRKRYARLVTHAEVEWDELKERDLAVEFVNAKVGFFKLIAGNLKLEWRQVEKKCLELGLKTLLEKGKRITLPFPPLEFQQSAGVDVAAEDTTRRGSSPIPQINMESLPPLLSPPAPLKAKATPHPKPSDRDDNTTPTRPFRLHKGPGIVKGGPTADQGEYSEEVSREGGDELGNEDEFLKIPAKVNL